MSNRSLIRLNTGAADSSLFAEGYQNSYFRYTPWDVVSDKIRDIKQLLVNSNLSFGQQTSFDVDKVGTLLEDIKADITISAITPTGTGTYARVCDYGGLALTPSILVTYQQNVVQKYDSFVLWFKHLRDPDIRTFPIFDAQLGGNLTTAQRNTNALNPQTFRVYLKPYWYMVAGHSPTLTALANKIKITISFANLTDFIQTDYTGGATCTLQNINWIYEVINTTGEERDSFSSYTFSPEGVTYLIEENHDQLFYKVPAGTVGQFIVPLTGFTLPFTAIYAQFQPYADVTTSYQKKLFEPQLADFNLISYATLRDGDTANFETAYNGNANNGDFMDHWQKKHSHAVWRKPVLFWGLGEVVDLKNCNTGSFNSSNINNFQILLNIPTALTQDYSLSVVLFEHNWVNHQGGEIQKIFNA